MKRDVVIVAGGGVVAVLPFLVGDYWIGLATQALIYGAVAAGLDVLVGYAGLPSLGHAAFFGLAGYGTALLTTVSGIDPMVAAGIAVVATVVVAAALAPFVTRLRGLGFITVTLAFGQVVWGMAVRGGSLTGGENGIAAVPRPLLPGDLLATRSGFFWATIVLVVAALLVVSRLTQSSFGLSLLGVRDASRRMTAIGYRVNLRRTIAFIVAAGIGAVFGVWFVFFNQFVGPSTLDWRLSATFLLAVVVGGSASLWGPFLAGATLQVVETTLTGQTSLWPMVLGVLYVFSVLVIPDGVVSIPRKLGRLRADTKATATAGTEPVP